MDKARRSFLTGVLASACAPAAFAEERHSPNITVAVSSDTQLNGVAQARDGRLFVSMPRWSSKPTPSVTVFGNSAKSKPFPGGSWNEWEPDRSPGDRFVCVNTLRIDPAGGKGLWVVDAGSPAFGAVVEGAPKLTQFDLDSGLMIRNYNIDKSATGPTTYLNDVRFAKGHAFISDSGEGAIIVIDLSSGHARQVLFTSASTKAVAGRTPIVNERPVKKPDGSIPKVNVDGIELSRDQQWILYAVPFGGWLWRVRVVDLINASLSNEELDRRVERLGPLGPIGGMTAAPDGGLFLSDVQQHAIVHRSQEGRLRTIAQDPRLRWPDASTLDHAGNLLVAASQVSGMPPFNQDKDTLVLPFEVLRLTLGGVFRHSPS